MLVVVLAFLAGLLVGSFLNVCIFRLPRDLSVVRPRSFCPGCEKTISWYDNVPVLSYILLRGRCRYCHERIPLRYLVVELATGAAFAVCMAAYGPSLEVIKFSIFSAILITLIASDIEERILPDEFTLGGTAVGLVLAYFVTVDKTGPMHFLLPRSFGPRWMSVGEAVLGAAFTSGSIGLVGWLYQKLRHREGLGLGDVKMIAMIGAFLGLKWALLTLITASVFGAIGGLIYIFVTGKDSSTYELPFGSFLGMAALAVAMYGEVVAAWYARLGT
jgi:leader peptidase (prepilin peptidase)/N-methyltransferase